VFSSLLLCCGAFSVSFFNSIFWYRLSSSQSSFIFSSSIHAEIRRAIASQLPHSNINTGENSKRKGEDLAQKSSHWGKWQNKMHINDALDRL
jgi:hypothetical protein